MVVDQTVRVATDKIMLVKKEGRNTMVQNPYRE